MVERDTVCYCSSSTVCMTLRAQLKGCSYRTHSSEPKAESQFDSERGRLTGRGQAVLLELPIVQRLCCKLTLPDCGSSALLQGADLGPLSSFVACYHRCSQRLGSQAILAKARFLSASGTHILRTMVSPFACDVKRLFHSFQEPRLPWA